ncbi:FMR1-interacting protein NUFIP2-like [Trichomycterus rosablanca]|uniref:FMR1-interacting protein NUFIP2-like n=1 Tax=Trichomycterus rosablanca TaxID=2290929 RepID=UPI002F350A86
MDGNLLTSGSQRFEVRNLQEREPVLTMNREDLHSSSYITNGYSSKAADSNSGSESGYTTPKKGRARRGSMKGPENASQEKENVLKVYSKQDAETPGQDIAGKRANSQPNCSRIYLKPEVHASLRKTDAQDTIPVSDLQYRNSDSKALRLVGKKNDDRVSKTKPTSSVTSKDDLWTLFRPPPVFPVDNSSAKIVPKISYASKVKENLNKATTQASPEVTQASTKPLQVPGSAVKTVTSADNPVSIEVNGCLCVGTLVDSAASASSSVVSVASSVDTACISSVAPEPQQLSLFVYPHEPLNMQLATPAAQTNQKGLGDIFQNQWGLSFINEPNAGPEKSTVSRSATKLKISDVTFQGESFSFITQPSLHPTSAVSFTSHQDLERRTSADDTALKHFCTAETDCLHAQPPDERISKSSEVVCEVLDAQFEVNSLVESSTCLSLKKDQDGLSGWECDDLQDAIFYHTKEFEYILTLQKQDSKRVVSYKEALDGPDQ